MSRSSNINKDVFFVILSHIYEPETIHQVLRLLSRDHPLFLVTLTRLLRLPVTLDWSSRPAVSESDSLTTIELLISERDNESGGPAQLANLIRHLIIDPQRGDDWRSNDDQMNSSLLGLFRKAIALEKVEWFDSFGPSEDQLQHLSSLTELTLICDPIDGRPMFEEEDNCYDFTLITRTIGPQLNSLNLQLVNIKLYELLLSQKSTFASYESLRKLKLDLTGGDWDWDGSGTPPGGASPEFNFQDLGFPAVKSLWLHVSDLTVSKNTVGPMALVRPNLLEELTVFISASYWKVLRNIRTFEALNPAEYSGLKCLQVHDYRRDVSHWYWPGEQPDDKSFTVKPRCFWGLVPCFLSSVRSGSLQHLTHLWVDQTALCMPSKESLNSESWDGSEIELHSPAQICRHTDDDEENRRKEEWVDVLRAVFSQVESLRVGFGPMELKEIDWVLGFCSPQRMTQVGFEWKWDAAAREKPVTSKLVDLFKRFTKLKDIHLLNPRPGTKDAFRSELLQHNKLTITDIESFFSGIPSLCRVGWGRITVWERNCTPLSLVQPGCSAKVLKIADVIDQVSGQTGMRTLGGVPEFFDAGLAFSDSAYSDLDGGRIYPTKEEMKELRMFLQRTLPVTPR